MLMWLRNSYETLTGLKLRSSQWSRVRETFLKSNPHCRACNSAKKLEVHHIKPFHVFPALELDTSNLVTLCESHHLTFGHLMDFKSYNPNVVEDCHEYNEKMKARVRMAKTNEPSGLLKFLPFLK